MAVLEKEKTSTLVARPAFKARYDNFIGGKWVAPVDGEYFDNISPIDGKVFTQVARSNHKDVELALDAAHKAFPAWARTSAAERSNMLLKIADVVEKNLDYLATVETIDNGKAIRETRAADIPLVVDHFRYYAGVIRAEESTVAELDANTLSMNIKEPIGVVAQIIPWNFPLLMAAWKIAPALAAGNTVVLKPAETTSLTALKLAEIIREADLPPGVVNIITGAGATGAALVNHPDINKIAFTGSTDVGKIIQKAIAGTKKKYTLELGGKAANIIFEDAAIDQAVEGIINGIFFNQGHVCCAGSRLFVQESVAKTVIRKLKDRMETLIVGDPLDKNTDIGAINSKDQLEKIKKYIKIGVNEGGEMYQANCPIPSKGFFYRPTLFTNVSQSSRIVSEEIFGPVLAIQTFRTVEEVIEKANNIPYGLSGGVWTDKGSKIFKVTSQLRAGVIWANTYNKFDPTSPFGGYKESGVGREGGLHGLMPYLTIQN